RPELDAQHPGPLDVQVQRPGPAPPRHATDGALGHPALIDQLIDDGRHRAALQAGAPRQVRSRHRLMPADETQRDPPVYLARRLARGDLEIRQVNLAHDCRIPLASLVAGLNATYESLLVLDTN